MKASTEASLPVKLVMTNEERLQCCKGGRREPKSKQYPWALVELPQEGGLVEKMRTDRGRDLNLEAALKTIGWMSINPEGVVSTRHISRAGRDEHREGHLIRRDHRVWVAMNRRLIRLQAQTRVVL